MHARDYDCASVNRLAGDFEHEHADKPNRRGGTPVMTQLLTLILVWIGANFDSPATFDHPRIEQVPAAQISDMRYAGVPLARRRDVVAIYNDRKNTIYLADTWRADSPRDLSVLVHEMVHHLQNRANIAYECPGAREELAYAAQALWLQHFGDSLEAAFDVDPFTLKVTTSCMLH
jgi:hypothetical protein